MRRYIKHFLLSLFRARGPVGTRPKGDSGVSINRLFMTDRFVVVCVFHLIGNQYAVYFINGLLVKGIEKLFWVGVLFSGIQFLIFICFMFLVLLLCLFKKKKKLA